MLFYFLLKMKKTEELEWCKIGRIYSDNFFGNFRVKQVLKRQKLLLNITTKQNFLDSYGNRISQLELTYIRLKRFPIFLSSSSLALEKRGISRVAQFIYHIENYLALIYIFDQRIRRLVKFIEKSAKKYQCQLIDIQELTSVKNILLTSIEPLVLTRGKHTHEKYFYDKNFEEMERYDKAGDFSFNQYEKKAFKLYAKKLLSIQRKKWKEDINGDINRYEVQIGIMYTKLDKLVWQIYKKI